MIFQRHYFLARRAAACLAILIITLVSSFQLFSQDPHRFKEQTDSLCKLVIDPEPGKPITLFTGSSSIRMWEDVQDYFPDYYTINTGFGGSHMSDLLFFLDELVLQYRPDKIFIYEGDNDVAHGKRPGVILKDYKQVTDKIHSELPGVPIYLITPKPSLARWHLADQYQKVNKRISKLASRDDELFFIDVWPVMLGPDAKPIEELFIEDGIHMNAKGYILWAEEINKFL